MATADTSMRLDRDRLGVNDEVLETGKLTRVSWAAIFAGVACALGVTVLLSLLGLAIGFGVVDPIEDRNPTGGMATGSGIWFGLTTIVALFVGGFVGGRLAGIPMKMTAMLHGAVIWAITTIAMVYMATTSAGYLMSGATSAVSQAASLAGSATSGIGSAASAAMGAAGDAMPNQMPAEVQRELEKQDMTVQDVRQELRDIMANAGLGQQDLQEAGNAAATLAEDIATSPGDAGADIQAFIDKLYGGEDAVISDEERQQAIATLQQRTGVSEEEATQLWQQAEDRLAGARDQVVQAMETAQQEALQAAETTLDGLTAAAFAAFVASLIGLVAAVFGGAAGKPEDMPVVRSA